MGHDPFEGQACQWIEGTIDRQLDYFEVQLFERDADGNTLGSRRLREQANDCHQLDEAIVLAIALIIDPGAKMGQAAATTAPAVTGEGAPSTAPHSLALPLRQPAPIATRMVPSFGTGPEPTGPVRAVMTPNKAESRLGTAFVAADAVVLHGVLPGFAFGAEWVTRIALDAGDRAQLRLSALYLPEKVASHEGRLGYGLTALEAGGCLQDRTRHWVTFGCVGFGLGGVHVVVYDPAPRKPDDRLWSAFRFEAGAAVQIAGPVWVEARLFDLVALQRWAFQVVQLKDGVQTESPSPVAFEQKWPMPGAALGLGLHFD